MSDLNGNDAQEAKETIEAATDAFKAVEANVNEAFAGLDMAVPEAVRTVAEKTVTQSREAYENAITVVIALGGLKLESALAPAFVEKRLGNETQARKIIANW